MPRGVFKDPEERARKISASLKGHAIYKSVERSRKLSLALTGKISAFKGKKHTIEAKEKCRLANLGKGPNKGSFKQGQRPVNYIDGRKVYRKIKENQIDRTIKPKEIVHHFDGNRKNNCEDNLCLLRHQTAHKRLHNFVRRHGLEIGLLKFEQPWLYASSK